MVYEGGHFIYKDTQKLPVSQNRFTEVVILFTETVEGCPSPKMDL